LIGLSGFQLKIFVSPCVILFLTVPSSELLGEMKGEKVVSKEL
jgi:hypothetical protein